MSDKVFYIITDVDITLVMPDATEQTMTLQAPNSRQKPYEMIAQLVDIQEDYMDPEFQPQRGHKKFRFEFVFGYDWHRMDLTALLAAETVKLKVPVYLWEDSRYYQEFDCKLLNKEFSNAALQGLYAQGTGGNSNRAPRGNQELRFRSPTYNWDELPELLRFLHGETLVGDDGEPIIGFVAGTQTEDGQGVEAEPYSPAATGSTQQRTYTIAGKDFNLNTVILQSNEQ